MRRIRVTTTTVMIRTGLFVLVDVVVLCLWMGLAHPREEIEWRESSALPKGVELRMYPGKGHGFAPPEAPRGQYEAAKCASRWTWVQSPSDAEDGLTDIFNTILITYKGVILAAGCYVAYVARNLNHSFGETKQLVFAIYNIALLGAILVFVTSIESVTSPARVFISTLGTSLLALLVLLSIVGPKILYKNRVQDISTATSGTSGTSPTHRDDSNSKHKVQPAQKELSRDMLLAGHRVLKFIAQTKSEGTEATTLETLLGKADVAHSFSQDTRLALAYVQNNPADRTAAALLFPGLEACALQVQKINDNRSTTEATRDSTNDDL